MWKQNTLTIMDIWALKGFFHFPLITEEMKSEGNLLVCRDAVKLRLCVVGHCLGGHREQTLCFFPGELPSREAWCTHWPPAHCEWDRCNPIRTCHYSSGLNGVAVFGDKFMLSLQSILPLWPDIKSGKPVGNVMCAEIFLWPHDCPYVVISKTICYKWL